MPSPALLLSTAALSAAVLVPSAAQAAEGFTAVTVDGKVTHLQSDAIPSLKPVPIAITGLASGERVVGLDRAPSGELLALTSAGRIDVLDAATGKATPKLANPVVGPVDPNGSLTFAVAPDGGSARIITAGRDVTINLTTGAATNATGLTFAAGDPHAGVQATPALDYAGDGRLIGAAAAQGAFAAQTAPGAATLSTLAKLPFSGIEPVRSTVASDGSVWTISTLGTGHSTSKQSRIVRYDPASGRITGQNGVFLLRKFEAIAGDGAVPDDTTKPKATFSDRVLRRKVTAGHAYFAGLRLEVSEGGQSVASLRYRGKVAGFGLVTRETKGSSTFQFGPRKDMGTTLRRAAANHRRAVVHVTVRDWAGNKRIYDVPVRLSL
ncbi:MAG: hypothetical protein V7607_6462 [Solirubrobacteraceae bacterium]